MKDKDEAILYAWYAYPVTRVYPGFSGSTVRIVPAKVVGFTHDGWPILCVVHGKNSTQIVVPSRHDLENGLPLLDRMAISQETKNAVIDIEVAFSKCALTSTNLTISGVGRSGYEMYDTVEDTGYLLSTKDALKLYRYLALNLHGLVVDE